MQCEQRTSFDIMNVSADTNSYTTLTFSICATRPIEEAGEVEIVARDIRNLSSFLGNTVRLDSGMSKYDPGSHGGDVRHNDNSCRENR